MTQRIPNSYGNSFFFFFFLGGGGRGGTVDAEGRQSGSNLLGDIWSQTSAPLRYDLRGTIKQPLTGTGLKPIP